jgi:threonine aldolase
MTKKEIADFRSDTVTKPCESMRKAMAQAEVGDSMFGEDPSVSELEDKVSSELGFDYGLYVPSGTMSNQIAIGVHTSPGETIIAEESSHFYLYESGATSALSGAQFEVVPDLENEAVKAKIRPKFFAGSKTSLFIYENTHNEKGGDARSKERTQRALSMVDGYGLTKHLDGARIWNAASALKCSEKDLAEGFDSASVCMSKGLGAPVGSLLLINGSDKFEKAVHLRKRFGGSMRQAGILAKACLYAYENNRSRLLEDSEKSGEMQNFLESFGFQFKDITCPTNMLYFKRDDLDSDNLAAKLNEVGIKCFKMSEDFIRFVFHKDINSEAMKVAYKEMEKIFLALKK